MNLVEYSRKLSAIAAYVRSSPQLQEYWRDVDALELQAGALSTGAREFPTLERSSSGSVPIEHAKRILDLLGTGPGTEGVEENLELLRAFACVERNLAVCLIIPIMRDYPELVPGK